MAWQAWQRQVRSGQTRSNAAMFGVLRLDMTRRGRPGTASPNLTGPGETWIGKVRYGRLGWAGIGRLGRA